MLYTRYPQNKDMEADDDFRKAIYVAVHNCAATWARYKLLGSNMRKERRHSMIPAREFVDDSC